VACPICTSYAFRVTYSFLGEQMYVSGKCLTCGFERGNRDPSRLPLDPVADPSNLGRVDTPAVS
jgi:transposase-like protein